MRFLVESNKAVPSIEQIIETEPFKIALMNCKPLSRANVIRKSVHLPFISFKVHFRIFKRRHLSLITVPTDPRNGRGTMNAATAEKSGSGVDGDGVLDG